MLVYPALEATTIQEVYFGDPLLPQLEQPGRSYTFYDAYFASDVDHRLLLEVRELLVVKEEGPDNREELFAVSFEPFTN